MISTVRFPPSYCSNSNSLSFSHKIQLVSSSSSSSLAVNFRNLRFPVVYVQKSRNFGLTSQRKRRKPGGAPVLEMDSDSDEDGDDDDDDDEELEMDDDDDDDDITVPFGKMKKWLQKKPRGFGVGKSYDTPIEDQLLEEIEKTAKLRNDAVKTTSQQNNTKVEAVPAGFGVRVTNLPKKKNVHRDLSAAFKQVPGLVSINPAVIGNKKTKDPICKGFAFVHFKSEKDATRFVEMYSSQSLAFGKIQKQIKCEVVNSEEQDSGEDKSKVPRITTPRLSAIKPVTLKAAQTPKPATDKYTAPASKPSTDNYTDPQLTVSALGDEEVDSELVDSSLDTLEEILSNEYEGSDLQLLGLEVEDLMENPQLTVAAFGDEEVDSDLDEYEGPDVQLVGPEPEDFRENLATSTVSHLHGADSDAIELRTESESLVESSSSNQLLAKSEKAKASQKKAVKGKVQGSPKKNKVTILNGGDSDNIELRTESESLAESSSSDQLFAKSEKEKAPRQKKAVKAEVEGSPKKKKVTAKAPKLAIGGSSKRLKVKEKAVLSEVFSKYGINPGLASKEDS